MPDALSRREFLKKSIATSVYAVAGFESSQNEKRILSPVEIVNDLLAEVEGIGVSRKIAELKKYLKGFDPDGLFVWIEADINFLRQCSQKIQRSKKLSSEDEMSLRIMYGERWDDISLKNKEVQLAVPRIKGFEQIQGWDNKKIYELLLAVAPKGRANLRRLSIEYDPDSDDLKSEVKKTKAASVCPDLEHIVKPGLERKIIIGELQPQQEGARGIRQALIDLFLHELAHQHDWLNFPRIGMLSRVEFLHDMMILFRQFISSQGGLPAYVGEIRETSGLRKETLQAGEIEYREIQELWAMLAEDLSLPLIVRKKSSPRTFPIMEKWVLATSSK